MDEFVSLWMNVYGLDELCIIIHWRLHHFNGCSQCSTLQKLKKYSYGWEESSCFIHTLPTKTKLCKGPLALTYLTLIIISCHVVKLEHPNKSSAVIDVSFSTPSSDVFKLQHADKLGFVKEVRFSKCLG